MTRKRKHAQREELHRKRAAEQGRIVSGRVIPEGAIPADQTKQAANNSYSPPLYYADQEFNCVDCGSPETWTASQQKWYYEVAKGSIYGRAVRCRACRRKRRDQTKSTSAGDPQPIKNPGMLLAFVRKQIEPLLTARGFDLESRNDPREQRRRNLWINYRGNERVFSLQWSGKNARLAAEVLTENGNVECVAETTTDLVQTHTQLMSRVGPFLEQIKSFLLTLPNQCEAGRDRR